VRTQTLCREDKLRHDAQSRAIGLIRIVR
jgi:hypothetical protein